jgi:hypothetical protein
MELEQDRAVQRSRMRSRSSAFAIIQSTSMAWGVPLRFLPQEMISRCKAGMVAVNCRNHWRTSGGTGRRSGLKIR